MGVSYQQTATAAGAGSIVACSGGTLIGGSQEKNSLCTVGGTAGGAVTVGGTQLDAETNQAGVMFEIVPGGTAWASGNYVVRLNVTTANANVTWTATHICRLNSSNVNQATIGSLTAQTTSLSPTGVKTHTVSGSSQSPSAGDKVYIVCIFSCTTANQSFGVTFNQLIDTPLLLAKTAGLSDSAAFLADSVARVRTPIPWKDTVAVTLNVAGTTAKTFTGSDALVITDALNGFRRERAGVTETWATLADTLTGFEPKRATFSDTWANLADLTTNLRKGLYKLAVTDSWQSLADTIAAKRIIRVALTDSVNFLADSAVKTLTTFTTPKTFSGSDSLSISDTLAGFRRERVGLTDSAYNLVDSVAKNLLTAGGGWRDSLTINLQIAGLINVRLQDTFGTIDYLLDASGNPVFDATGWPIILSITNSWADSAGKTLGTTASTPKTFTGSDSLNLGDSLAGSRRVRAALQDSMAQADSIRALFGLRPRFTDPAANLADLITLFLLAPDLRLQLTDTWQNEQDSVSASLLSTVTTVGELQRKRRRWRRMAA